MLTKEEIYDLYLYSSHPEEDIKAFAERWPMLRKYQVKECMYLASRIGRSLGFVSDHLNVFYEGSQEETVYGGDRDLVVMPVKKYRIEFNY